MPESNVIIVVLYITYSIITLSAFWFFPVRRVALAAFFAGWLLLPVAIYPAYTISDGSFTKEVIGAALPSNLGLTKALLIPLTIVIGLSIRQPSLWQQRRIDIFDIAIATFCVWPLSQLFADNISVSQSLQQTAYLLGSWGGTWMVGRLVFHGEDAGTMLLHAIGWSGVALLPFSLLEGIAGPIVYPIFYGDHPFLLDGHSRDIGFRPMGLFEHGNQFGIWLAMAALAWIQIMREPHARHRIYKWIGAVVVAGAVASQSYGAIFLLIVGGIAILLPRKLFRQIFVAAIGGAFLMGAVYISGAIPVRQIEQSVVGSQTVHELLQKTMRGSLRWRIRKDLESLDLIHQAPVQGYGTWDWWRPLNAHPWGLPLLLAGQFGWIALFLALFAVLGRAAHAIFFSRQLILPIIVFAAAVDAALNSYIYFPALVIAGALTGLSRPEEKAEEPAPHRG